VLAWSLAGTRRPASRLRRRRGRLANVGGSTGSGGGKQRCKPTWSREKFGSRSDNCPASCAARRPCQVFGQGDLAQELAEELRPRLEPMGLTVTLVASYSAADFGVELPADAPVSRRSAWPRGIWLGGLGWSFSRRKSNRGGSSRRGIPRASWSGRGYRGVDRAVDRRAVSDPAMAAFELAIQMGRHAPTVGELDNLQQQIRKFRPWFDDSLRTLSILRRSPRPFRRWSRVGQDRGDSRSGDGDLLRTARDSQALLKTLDQLRATRRSRT